MKLSLIKQLFKQRIIKVRMHRKLSKKVFQKESSYEDLKTSEHKQQTGVTYEKKGLLNRKGSIKSIGTSSLWCKNEGNKLVVKNGQKLFRNEDFRQMNQLYEENQKLGYRINYLNDENNFYRISINNIEKLNNKIKKDLDANEIQHNTRQNQPKTKINIYKEDPNKKNLYIPNQIESTNWNPILSSEDKQKQQWLNGGWKGSSLKLISNKIHLKNLQIKVGNSIRQTQKLKRIYQGSLSSLSKKAQDLQDEINKMVRQSEYYGVEADLLRNIYKADFYFNFHSDWLSLYNSSKVRIQQKQLDDNNINGTDDKVQQASLASGQEESVLIQERQYCLKVNQPIKMQHKIKPIEYPYQRNTQMHSKHVPSVKKQSTVEKKKPTQKESAGLQVINSQNYPMAIRFLSCSYNHNHIGSTGKTHGWYSTLYPKSKVNKLLEMIDSQSNKQGLDNKTAGNGYYKESTQVKQPNTHMSEKQLFLLPQSLVKFVLNSIEKQQIQQNNNLQSLRKQQKEQRKNHLQLTQKIQGLNEKKKQLKQLVDEEFSAFFMKNIQRLDIISSSSNNNNGLIRTNKSKEKIGQLRRIPGLSSHKNSRINLIKGQNRDLQKGKIVSNSIKQRKQQADQLLICSIYERQLIQEISRRQCLLEQQFRINQQYKQKIIDRNEQQGKEIKVLEEQVSKCHEQLNELKLNYKLITQNSNHHFNQIGNIN